MAGIQVRTSNECRVLEQYFTSRSILEIMKLDTRAIQMIDGRNIGYLATIMKDGSPQVTPVWVDYEDGLILVNTTVGRVKQKNTKVNPKVAISIADASNQYDMITIRGIVVEQSTSGAEDHIHKLAKKYLSKEKFPWLSSNEARIILKIEPEHYTA